MVMVEGQIVWIVRCDIGCSRCQAQLDFCQRNGKIQFDSKVFKWLLSCKNDAKKNLPIVKDVHLNLNSRALIKVIHRVFTCHLATSCTIYWTTMTICNPTIEKNHLIDDSQVHVSLTLLGPYSNIALSSRQRQNKHWKSIIQRDAMMK